MGFRGVVVIRVETEYDDSELNCDSNELVEHERDKLGMLLGGVSRYVKELSSDEGEAMKSFSNKEPLDLSSCMIALHKNVDWLDMELYDDFLLVFENLRGIRVSARSMLTLLC